MHVLRIVSCIIFFLTFGMLALSSPAPAGFELEKRTESGGGDKTDDIKAVLSTLESITDKVLQEINTVVDQKKATIGVIEPLLEEIVKAIHDAHISLIAFGGVSLGNSINATEIAIEAEKVIEEVVKTIETADETLAGLLASLLSTIDSDLSGLLKQLDTLTDNLLGILVPLLESLGGITSGTLSGISFIFVVGVLFV